MTLRNLSENTTLSPSGLRVRVTPSPAVAPGPDPPPPLQALQPGRMHSSKFVSRQVWQGPLSGRVEGFIATTVEIKGVSNYLENSILQNMPRTQFLPWSPFIMWH